MSFFGDNFSGGDWDGRDTDTGDGRDTDPGSAQENMPGGDSGAGQDGE